MSDECIDLLKNMLCKDQEARYDIADVLLHPWIAQSFSNETDDEWWNFNHKLSAVLIKIDLFTLR